MKGLSVAKHSRTAKTQYRKFETNIPRSDLYIHTIGLPILLQENMWTDPGNI
jgi:hypothetical protein